MGLFQFKTAPHSMIDKNLLNLRSRLGGTIGQIKSGMETLDAVKVRDNVYVTARKPSASLRAMVNLGRADIHQIDHPADIQLMIARLETLDG